MPTTNRPPFFTIKYCADEACDKLINPVISRAAAENSPGKVSCDPTQKIKSLPVQPSHAPFLSLEGFAQIVDLFGKHNASFVSVTQQFNAASSMGQTLRFLQQS